MVEIVSRRLEGRYCEAIKHEGVFCSKSLSSNIKIMLLKAQPKSQATEIDFAYIMNLRLIIKRETTMPLHVSWGNAEKTFTLFEFVGKWSWEDYYQARSDAIRLVEDVPHMVNIIVDLTQSSIFPANMLSHFGSSIDQSPKEFDLAIIVTNSKFLEAMANMISKIKLQTKFQVVRTRQEAYKLMATYDTSRV